ncbi:hypothetical protein AAIM60_22880 [Pseudomonas lijiangensis]|uniref:hypothetical protein n=1 Tax=Pseudomonas lijiangensis TaxID=2995658 RepID=UPI0031BA4265
MKRRDFIRGGGLLLASGSNLSFGLTRNADQKLQVVLHQDDDVGKFYARLNKFFFSEQTQFQPHCPKDSGRLPLTVRVVVQLNKGGLPLGAKIACCQPDTFKSAQKIARGSRSYTSWKRIEHSGPIVFETYVPAPTLKNRKPVTVLDFVVLYEGKWGVARVVLEPAVVSALKGYDMGQKMGGVVTTSLTDVALAAGGMNEAYSHPVVMPELGVGGVKLGLRILVG